KGWFWGGVALLGLVVGISGLILNFPNFEQTRFTMQIANITHGVGALLFMAASLGHIYMGTIGTEGAYKAMRTGYVDETWAKEHHELWLKDVKS
ncbi:MAG TPA: formate dehydrogenase subunit gamma, partial [Burkholderiales bacterium]|nr:formate dehydrogenase subunit gamma [Burkholderiales bacterium]